MLEGLDATIFKTATVVPPVELWEEEVYIFRPLQFQTQAVVKIACEPLNPSELPKMVPALLPALPHMHCQMSSMTQCSKLWFKLTSVLHPISPTRLESK